MKMQKTHILDPMASLPTKALTLEAHKPTIERLHAALANCIELPDWSKWNFSVVKSSNLTSNT
jgi:hypothetical protein